jgi:hypothetical protein
MPPVIPRPFPKRLSGNLPLHHQGKPIVITGCERKLIDFWQWALSDLMPNTNRSILAEYLVAIALGADEGTKQEWGAYDLQLSDGRTVEVKATARLQAWHQDRLTALEVKIEPTKAWDAATNEYASKPDYNADIYVVCCFMPESHARANLLDVSQWEFYVLSRRRLIEILDGRKKLAVNRLKACGEQAVLFDQLSGAVRSIG